MVRIYESPEGSSQSQIKVCRYLLACVAHNDADQLSRKAGVNERHVLGGFCLDYIFVLILNLLCIRCFCLYNCFCFGLVPFLLCELSFDQIQLLLLDPVKQVPHELLTVLLTEPSEHFPLLADLHK